MPCTLPVASYSELEVIGLDASGEPSFARSVPRLPAAARAEKLVVQPMPARGSVWLGASGVALGELLFLGGVGLFFSQPDGCGGSWSSKRTGCTLAKVGLIAGPVTGGLGGAYWGLYYRGDDLRVRVESSF